MCDVRTTLTVEPTIDTVRISEATEERGGSCLLAGIIRSIAIRFEPPLASEFVEFGARRQLVLEVYPGVSTSWTSSVEASTGPENTSVIRRSAPPSVSWHSWRSSRQI